MKLSHLQINTSSVSPFVLLPGDPARVDVIGNELKEFRIIGNNREFRTGVGLYKGARITVASTGIGCPSTAIAAEELIQGGAKVLIRVGTCGGAWRSSIPGGSIVIPTASVRDEGTTKEYIPEGFPAVADFQVVQALAKAANAGKQKYFIGINRTHDAFYGTDCSIAKWGAYLRDVAWRKYETPILSSEMESAALFIIASMRNVSAGAVFAVNADPEPLKARIVGKRAKVATEKSIRDTEKTVAGAIKVALEAIVSLHHTQSL